MAVGLVVVLFAGFVVYSQLTTTDVDSIEVGQCFASWDDFDGGQSGDYVPRSVDDADCDGDYAVQAYAITSAQLAGFGACQSAFDADIVRLRGQLDWFGVEVGRFGQVDKVVCFAGHADGETLISGSLLTPGS